LLWLTDFPAALAWVDVSIAIEWARISVVVAMAKNRTANDGDAVQHRVFSDMFTS
jgi:hypothetical protein